MGECESKPNSNFFYCVKCNEGLVHADNFCLVMGCRRCPMCDYCSTLDKHLINNSEMKYFQWLTEEFVNNMNIETQKYKENIKLKETADKIKILIDIWKYETVSTLDKKFEWLDEVRQYIKNYLMIPKILFSPLNISPTVKRQNTVNIKKTFFEPDDDEIVLDKDFKQISSDHLVTESLKSRLKKNKDKISNFDEGKPRKRESSKKC